MAKRIGQEGGLKSNAAKLRLNEVKQIQKLYQETDVRMKELAGLYRVTTTTIWRHLKNVDSNNKLRYGKNKVEENNNLIKLTRKEVKQILLLRLREGLTQSKIAKMFDIHQSTVSNICTGKSWKHLFQGIRDEYRSEELKVKN